MKILLLLSVLLSANAHAAGLPPDNEHQPLVQYSCQTSALEGNISLVVSQNPNNEAAGELKFGNSLVQLHGTFAVTSQDANSSQTGYQLVDANEGKIEVTITKKLNFNKFCGRGSCDFVKIQGTLSYKNGIYHFPSCYEN
ncbi:MAG: hypothetical protein ACXWQO_12805 [Bdellovibrionota bacterium]